jgi:hypothetical protein
VPPGYGTPYGAPPAAGSNQLSLISMILGIISLVTSFCCSFFAVPLAIGAVTTGIIALSQLRSDPRQQGKGQATAGIACGGVAVVVQIAFLVFQLGSFAFSPSTS